MRNIAKIALEELQESFNSKENLTLSSAPSIPNIESCYRKCKRQSVGWLVVWWVCNNFLKDLEVTLPCSYHSIPHTWLVIIL